MSGERGAADDRLVADIAATIEEETSLGWDTDIVARVVYERHVAALLDEVRETAEYARRWIEGEGTEYVQSPNGGEWWLMPEGVSRTDVVRRLSALLSRLKREEASDG